MDPEVKPPPDADKKTETPGLPEALGFVANAIFKKEALLVLASTVALLVCGGVTVVYAQSTGKAFIVAAVDAGQKDLLERETKLEERLDAHVQTSKDAHTAQDATQRRTEAKVDRLDVRMEQLIAAVYAKEGKLPPPAPPLVGLDGGLIPQ